MNDNKFWMVYSPQGNAPTHQHPTPEAAQTEAERLITYNPRSTFYVLEAVKAVRPIPQYTVTELGDSTKHESPFDDPFAE